MRPIMSRFAIVQQVVSWAVFLLKSARSSAQCDPDGCVTAGGMTTGMTDASSRSDGS
jgi:hypothetical protein